TGPLALPPPAGRSRPLRTAPTVRALPARHHADARLSTPLTRTLAPRSRSPKRIAPPPDLPRSASTTRLTSRRRETERAPHQNPSAALPIPKAGGSARVPTDIRSGSAPLAGSRGGRAPAGDARGLAPLPGARGGAPAEKTGHGAQHPQRRRGAGRSTRREDGARGAAPAEKTGHGAQHPPRRRGTGRSTRTPEPRAAP
ncbi:MAG: hypothetical protein RLZZ387_3820, partial [Chloroflexota bacterium]